MEFDKNQLQKKLDYYFEGKLTKNELGKWENRAYYDFFYLDSYIGNRNFYLLISYRNGVPDILLVVG